MCCWELRMTELGDERREEEEAETLGDILGEAATDEKRELDRAGEIEKKMHRHITREGEKERRRHSEGRKWEQERAIDCRLCTCRTERKSTRQNQMSSFGKRPAGSLTHLARGPLWLSPAIPSNIHQNSSALPRVRFIWSKHMLQCGRINHCTLRTQEMLLWCIFTYLSDKQRGWMKVSDWVEWHWGGIQKSCHCVELFEFSVGRSWCFLRVTHSLSGTKGRKCNLHTERSGS